MTAALEYDERFDPPPAAPHDLEVEQALLAAILLNNDAYSQVVEFLKPDHFYDPIHRRIYEVCGARISGGRVADPLTIRSYFEGVTKIGDITIAEYLARVAGMAVTIGNAEEYGKTIIDLSVRRELITVANETISVARKWDSEPASAILEGLEEKFSELRASHGIGAPQLSPGVAISEAMNLISDSNAGRIVGWPWCLPEVALTMQGPLQPGNLDGLLASSGDGKTSLVLMQLRFAAGQGVPFYFLSGEQSRAQCVMQMASQRLGIEVPHMLKRDGLTQAEADAIFEDAQSLNKLPWAIETWADSTVAKLGVRVRAFVKKYGPGIIAIDHARKIQPKHERANLADQVFQVFSDVKELMVTTGCAGILLMQRNSDFLKRRHMEPVRGDCYGGEGTLQNLDRCLTIFRPARWLAEAARRAERDSDRGKLETEAYKRRGKAEFGTLKNRYGEEGRTVEVEFRKRFTLFVSPTADRLAESPELPV